MSNEHSLPRCRLLANRYERFGKSYCRHERLADAELVPRRVSLLHHLLDLLLVTAKHGRALAGGCLEAAIVAVRFYG